MAYYKSVDIFKNIDWFDGIDRVLSLNAEVFINSNCYTQAISDVKREQLHAMGFDDAHIKLNIVSEKNEEGIKTVGEEVFIFVDDSPYNIANSKAKHNIMLTRPWNTSEDGQTIIGNKKVIYCNTLNEIMDNVERLLKEDTTMSKETISLQEILDNIMYDLTFANGITLHGNLEYVSQHYGDDLMVSNVISDNQPSNVRDFCNELFNYNKEHNTKVSITDFYNKVWSKEN